MTIHPASDGFPEVRGTIGTPLGDGEFDEFATHWVHMRHYFQRRQFRSGPLLSSTYNFDLRPAANGVIPTVRFVGEGRGRIVNTVSSFFVGRIRERARALLESLPAPSATRVEPVAQRSFNPGVQAAIDKWLASSSYVAESLVDHIRTAANIELQRIRVYELADRAGLDRDEMLVAALEGIDHGALEMYWSVRCPRCHAQTHGQGNLSDVADHSECTSCNITFTADLGDSVEVLFTPHPSVVPRVNETFCTLFPAASPGIHSLFFLQPGQTLEETVPLDQGTWKLGASGNKWPDQTLLVNPEHETTEHAWQPGGLEPIKLATGDVQIRLQNPTEGRLRVQILTSDVRDNQVPASRLTTLPSFRRRMSDQVLALDQRISVRSVALLFTDLSGSTAMYEELGDARAFAVVRGHFRVLREEVEEHKGVVVKTIGDAIMASFHTPSEAFTAGIAMIQAFNAWMTEQALEHPPGLRAGIHVGPALCVHTEASGLDYFGRTVNIAARTEGQAGPGQIAWTQDVHDRIQHLIADVEVERLDAELKGIAQSQAVFRASAH
jgi:adenylate cyclase